MFLKPRGQLFPLTSHPGHELETSGVRTHHHDKELHHIWMVKLAPEVKLSSTVVSLQVTETRTCTYTCTYRVILTANSSLVPTLSPLAHTYDFDRTRIKNRGGGEPGTFYHMNDITG